MRSGQEAILAEMRRWGYRFVVTPTLEAEGVLSLGLGPEQRRKLFKFADADGTVLAVVGEKTVPVARLAAGGLRTSPLPLRLCYAASVLANDSGRFSRRRETHQAGAELIGAAGPVADAEVIALAVRCLDAAGLGRYQVDVGHSEFFHGLLAGLRLDPEVEAGVKLALAARDFVALEELLGSTPLRLPILYVLTSLHGVHYLLSNLVAIVADRGNNRELVAAEPRHQVVAAQRMRQPQRDVADQFVADRMTERVVDVLEMVEVHKEQGDPGFLAAGRFDRLRDPVVEQGPVGETGEAVVQRLLLQRILTDLRIALVAAEGDRERP